MKKLVLPILVCILLLLCSCSGKKPDTPSQTESTAADTSEFSSEEQELFDSKPKPSDSDENVQTEAGMPEPPTEDPKPAGTQKPPASSQLQAPSDQHDPPKQSQPAEKPEQKPTQPTGPEETLPPVTKPTPPPESMTEPTVPEESPFDVGVYVEKAKQYGQQIGLRLEPTATACSDNPIFAGAECKYLERDLKDILDWYAASGFTAFWVWTEDLGNNEYSIFIGYA